MSNKTTPEFSDEILRRFPQKLQLKEFALTPGLKFLGLVLILVFSTLLFVLLLNFGISWGKIILIASLPIAAMITLWQFLAEFLKALSFSQGWMPSVEYFPSENHLLISDLHGWDNLFKSESQIIVHTDSLTAIEVICQDDRGWYLQLQTKKKEKILLSSSRRDSSQEAEALAHQMAAMIGKEKVKVEVYCSVPSAPGKGENNAHPQNPL